MKMKMPEKNIFPTIDFIYLSEEEKENYLSKGNLTYVKGKEDIKNQNFFNSNNDNNNKTNMNNFSRKELRNVFINNETNIKLLNKSIDNINCCKETIELHKIFENSIKCILLLKPYLNKMGSKSIKKMEFTFLKNDLLKKGFNIDILLNGCLDCIKDILDQVDLKFK